MELENKYKLSSYLKRLPWMHEKSTWSYSKIGSYRGCNKRFKYLYIDKVKVFDSDARFFIKGRLIHSLIERSIRAKYNLESEKLYNPVKDYPSISVESILEWNSIFKKFESSDAYCELIESINGYSLLDSEKSLDYKNLFAGYIDFIYVTGDTLYILDWKTGRSKELSFNQLCIYAYIMIEQLLDRGFNIKNVDLQYVFVEDLTYNRRLQKPIQQFLDDHLEVLISINETINQIESDTEWKRIRKDCNFCKLKTKCESDEKNEFASVISDILK